MLKRTLVFTTPLTVTDKQYANIINRWGKIEQKIQKKPIQLEFF